MDLITAAAFPFTSGGCQVIWETHLHKQIVLHYFSRLFIRICYVPRHFSVVGLINQLNPNFDFVLLGA